MNKNIYENLTNEQLLKKRDLLKGVTIGLGIVALTAIVIISYLIFSNGIKNVPFATLIPVFALPVTFTPVMVSLGQINKEVKSRNLK